MRRMMGLAGMFAGCAAATAMVSIARSEDELIRAEGNDLLPSDSFARKTAPKKRGSFKQNARRQKGRKTLPKRRA